MVPVVGSLSNLGLLILGFIIGFIVKTVLPYEYKRLRRQSTQSREEVRQWNRETLELMTELRTACGKLERAQNPDLREKVNDVEDIRTRIQKHTIRAPDGASGDVVERLEEISRELQIISGSYLTFRDRFPAYIETHGKIPFKDELVNKDDIRRVGLVVKTITDVTLEDEIYPMVDDIEEELDST